MALTMTLSRALACSRTVPCALRPMANRSRALMVRAVKDDKEKQKSQAEQQLQKRDESTTNPSPTDQSESRLAARTPQQGYDLMPFRRMTDSMAQMQREMDALLDTFGFGSDFGFGRSPFSLMNTLTAPFAPALPRMAGSMNRLVPFEVEEDDSKYSVRVEVPGFTKSDVKVMVDPTTNMLTITGQKAAKEGETATSRMSFTRSFTLPTDVDSEKPICARTEHGVLTVELPKSPQAASPKVKEIPVEGA